MKLEDVKKIGFFVPGPPQGKARARTYRNNGVTRTVTPEKTVLYENLIKIQYEREAHGFRFGDDTPLTVTIEAFYAIPKSTTKKDRARIKSGELKPTKKPDLDNIAKVVCDALNGVAYRDDKNIVTLEVRKSYSERPGILVWIYGRKRRGENE